MVNQTPLAPLLRRIVTELVDDEDAVDIREVAGESAVLFEVRVSAADTGKVIGRDGLHAKSLRALMAAAGRKYGLEVTVRVLEPRENALR